MEDKLQCLSGDILFSDISLEHEVNKDETVSNFFEMETESGRELEGYVYSSSIRVRLEDNSFKGSRVRIPYTIVTAGMQPGDVLKGSFSIISNAGEHIMPFVLTVRHSVIESSMGEIRNLFHFTNLAKTDWDEAVRVFYDSEFINILTGHDAVYRNLYKGLTAAGNKNYNLEEFLIGISKKQIIEYKLSRETFRYSNPQADIETVIDLERNGWGYTLIAVKTDCDFIELETNRLEDSNFQNNRCHIKMTIKADKLHAGKNLGRVIFKHLYGRTELEVVVSNTKVGLNNLTGHKQKSNVYGLMRHYMDYKLGRISRGKWAQMSIAIIDHNLNIDDADNLESNLYKIYVLLQQEKYNEAKWLLDHKIGNDIEEADNEIYSFYLYLMCLYNVDEYYARQVGGQVRSIFDKDPLNWRLAWILMNLSQDTKPGTVGRYNFIAEQLDRGCNSPVMYLEMLEVLNRTPSVLTGLSDEIINVLYFGAKNGCIGEALARQVAYQAGKLKEYNRLIYKILEYLYKGLESDEILQSICLQLMRGDIKGSMCREWYGLAIRLNLSITGLFECYMNNLNLEEEQEIPKSVVMYFSYNSTLPMEQNAYLYAYVHKNRDNLNEVYDTYRPAIERFVVKYLHAGKVNKQLAYLYNEIIMNDMATVDNIKQIAGLMVRHGIRVENDDIVGVVVIDERLKEELHYSVKNRLAYVDIPSNDYTILLEDAMGNRFYSSKDYIIEKFFLPRRIMNQIEAVAPDAILLNLFICDGNTNYVVINDRNVTRYRYLEQCEAVTDEFRAAIRLPLIRYYLDNEIQEGLDEILEQTGRDDVSIKDRDELLRVLIQRGHIERAMEYVVYYGPESIEPQVLVRLATYLIEKEGQMQSSELLGIIYSAFERGKYNETVLQYLARFYKGSAKNLRNIWKAASGFYVDTYHICENMILQTLATGAYIGEETQVLREYVEGGAKSDIEIKYLEYLASDYFVSGRVIDSFILDEIARMYDNESRLPDVCILAYLQYYADNFDYKSLSPMEIKHIRRFIHIMYVDRNLMMPFMKEFRSISLEALEMSNLTMIEYRTSPSAKVVINYCINKDDEEHKGYIREEMQPVYGGVFTKAFLLFFGESLQYYVVEEKDGKEELTESDTVSCNETDNDRGCDRYCLVNDIAISNVLGDYDAALELLEEFKYKEYLVENLFHLQ